jgi:hypothetical protein
MGLTIHYSLRSAGDQARARTLIQALYQTAQDLPFKELGPVVELSGDQCDYDCRSEHDPLRWLLIQAEESVEVPAQRSASGGSTYQTYQRVRPLRLIGFAAWPGDGSEASNFGLCQFPAVVDTSNGSLKTRLHHWRWSSFCKTQYASDPRCGGVPHFLQCHLTVVAMLDRAKELGCLERVSDEGEFWEKRDLPALVAEIGSWNEMIAAFGGRLKDLLGDGPLTIQSAISGYPNFEQLEAAGQDKLPPGYAQLASLIDRVGQRLRPQSTINNRP